MKYKTPLRLVAIDSDLEDDSAIPIVELQESEAVTRKVPNPVVDSEIIPATPKPTLIKGATQRPLRPVSVTPQLPMMNAATQVIVNNSVPMPTKGRPLVSGRVMIVMGVAVLTMVAGVALIAGKFTTPMDVTPVGAKPTSATSGSQVEQAAVPSVPTAVPGTVVAPVPSSIKPFAETIRLEVTAQPMEAKLSLDGNVVAGHALSLKVPRDRGIHVISASAPGYIPFNQQVSFDGDVVLTITLQRSRAISSRPTKSSRPVIAAPKPKVEIPYAPATPTVKPSPSSPSVEPGMNLEGPVQRHNSKAIDERNPYKL